MASGFEGIGDSIRAKAAELANEEAARRLAEIARERGLTSVDSLHLDAGSSTGVLTPDVQQIRSRANEMLRSDV
ncbi:putative transcriptional regulator [Microbacterium proteolyticum]|uniref:Putative transcriptional regulator n=1 Tax=Microbacterium proteolyticum TaxID=1572644 RepID=A0A7W5GFP9_9MICO|nr:hypothetical protein [Microbacterium proteolyticum]MBB3158291.1 putative transcriptional regulator [Microbacterium proteolyticum]